MNKPQLTRADYRRLRRTQNVRIKALKFILLTEKTIMYRRLGDGKLVQRKARVQKLERELAAERNIQLKLKLLAK